MPSIHPSAVVEPGAELADGVRVGPFCLVETGVRIGAGTELDSHVVVKRGSTLGARNKLHAGCVIGGPPQDRTYAGEASRVEIGDDNVFRESTTVHGGTLKGDGTTRVGSGGLFMVGSHIAHDCMVADRVILTNYVSLGGHAVLDTAVVMGGHSAVVPFCRLGSMVFVAGGSMIERDVPPYLVVAGNRARVRGVNTVGLRRNGVPEVSVQALRRAQRALYNGEQPLQVAARQFVETADDPFVRDLVRAILDLR